MIDYQKVQFSQDPDKNADLVDQNLCLDRVQSNEITVQ